MPSCCSPNVPRFTRRIKIQSASTSTDGENTETMSTLASNVPAEIKYNGGNESRRGDQLASTGTHTVRIMYRTGIVPTMRLVTVDKPESETLHVLHSSIDDEHGRYLRIVAKTDQS